MAFSRATTPGRPVLYILMSNNVIRKSRKTYNDAAVSGILGKIVLRRNLLRLKVRRLRPGLPLLLALLQSFR